MAKSVDRRTKESSNDCTRKPASDASPQVGAMSGQADGTPELTRPRCSIGLKSTRVAIRMFDTGKFANRLIDTIGTYGGDLGRNLV